MSFALPLAAWGALDWVAVVAAGATVIGVLIALWEALAKRVRPIVVLHQDEGRDIHGAYRVHLTNESHTPATNVRYGVKLDGTKFPAGPQDGFRQLVPANGRVPVNGTMQATIPIWPYALARKPDPEQRVVFYAEYQGSGRRTWQSENPTDPLGSLRVRRLWFPRFQRWRQEHRRRRQESVFNRRLIAESRVNLDMSRLPLHEKLRRRLGR